MTLEGVVVSDKMEGTVIVQKNRLVKVRKYDRYKKARSRIPAHNPPCINAREGDIVRIIECRKLAKTVSFVVTEKIKSSETAPAEKPNAEEPSKGDTVKEAKKKKPKKKVKKQEAEVEDG
jgi:small subunit ribosomal protein S17